MTNELAKVREALKKINEITTDFEGVNPIDKYAIRSISKEALSALDAYQSAEEADYYYDADCWDFTTDDESDVLDDGLAYSNSGIIRLGRFKKLSDKYVCEVYNENSDEYDRKYFSSLEEAKAAICAARGCDEVEGK